MASSSAQGGPVASMDVIGDPVSAHVAAHGSASHPYLCRDAFVGLEGMRNLADALHFLCLLHGRHPGLIDHAARAPESDLSGAWFRIAAPAFGAERLYLTRLAVAAGPVPSTPGSAISEAAVIGQCHALEMLARSERRGCALGAAVALAADWRAVRPLLDHAAARLGVDATACAVPDEAATAAAVAGVATDPAALRALTFGADQLLLQHRGLFDLLEARQSARRDS